MSGAAWSSSLGKKGKCGEKPITHLERLDIQISLFG
jgi:hypothetical protein